MIDNGLSEQWDDQLVKIAKRVTQIEQTMALMKQQVQSERSYIQAAHVNSFLYSFNIILILCMFRI